MNKMRTRGGRSNQKMESWIKSRIKAGYGQGSFESYKPWINHRDFSSLGRNGTVHGNKINRNFELFSDLERNYFYILDYSNKVEDINEQFPLLDRKLMHKVATDLGVKPPKYVGSSVIYVMTTDFHLLIKDDNGLREAVRTVKYSEELDKPRVQEKLNVEREYFARKGIYDWKIITEETVDPVVAKNIRFFRGGFHLESVASFLEKTVGETKAIVKSFKNLVPDCPVAVGDFCECFDADYGSGSGISVLKHLLARKEVGLDLAVPFRKNELIVKKGDRINIVNGNRLP